VATPVAATPRLIAFHHEHIVHLPFPDLRGRVPLAMHGIQREHLAREQDGMARDEQVEEEVPQVRRVQFFRGSADDFSGPFFVEIGRRDFEPDDVGTTTTGRFKAEEPLSKDDFVEPIGTLATEVHEHEAIVIDEVTVRRELDIDLAAAQLATNVLSSRVLVRPSGKVATALFTSYATCTDLELRLRLRTHHLQKPFQSFCLPGAVEDMWIDHEDTQHFMTKEVAKQRWGEHVVSNPRFQGELVEFSQLRQGDGNDFGWNLDFVPRLLFAADSISPDFVSVGAEWGFPRPLPYD